MYVKMFQLQLYTAKVNTDYIRQAQDHGMLQKNGFVEHVWPANSALFIYVSTYSVETVK